MNSRQHLKCHDEYRRMLEKLSRLRQEMGLSQHQLADLLGWEPLRLQKIEGCEQRLDLVELHHLCQALKQDASTLIQQFETEFRNGKRD